MTEWVCPPRPVHRDFLATTLRCTLRLPLGAHVPPRVRRDLLSVPMNGHQPVAAKVQAPQTEPTDMIPSFGFL